MTNTLKALLLSSLVGCAGTAAPTPTAAEPVAAPSGASSESPGETFPDGTLLIIKAPADLPLGTSHPLTVTLRDANGVEGDVTGSVVWSSSAEGVVAVNRASRAVAMSEGRAELSARYREYSGTVTLIVTPAIVTELHVTPPPGTLNIFDGGAIGAVATYSDGHSADVTTSTWWTTSNAQVAFPIGANGMVRATGGGTATISGWYGGVKADAAVVVNGPALVGLTIDPPSLSLQPGDTYVLHAMALFADSSAAIIPTNDSRFVGDNAEVVAVMQDPSSCGLITAVGEGRATVRVTFAGLNANTIIDAADPIAPRPQ